MRRFVPSILCHQAGEKLTARCRAGLVLIAVFILTFITTMPDFDLWTRLAVGSIVFPNRTCPAPRHLLVPAHQGALDRSRMGLRRRLLRLREAVRRAWPLHPERPAHLLPFSVMIGKTIKLRGSKHSPSVLFYAFLGFALYPGIASLIRSHMFTYLFFIVWLYALERSGGVTEKSFGSFPAPCCFG